MIDYKDWNRVHEFDLDTAAKLWYVSAKNVYISDVPPLEDNPYYDRLIAAIRNNQLKIEDVHLSMGGPAILTRGNLINTKSKVVASNDLYSQMFFQNINVNSSLKSGKTY